MRWDELRCSMRGMEGSFDGGEDSLQAAKLTVMVESQMEWLDPTAADDRLGVDGGRGKDIWQALQGTGEVGRREGVKQKCRCVLVLSSIGIWRNMP